VAKQAFDVVIVGGGAAGCVLASRLSQRPGRSVLLLEAGPDYPEPTSRPNALLQPRSVADRSLLWSYPASLTRWHDTPVQVIRGRVIGGSGAINGVSFDRGVPCDYDAWGSASWRWPDVLEAFRQVENDHDYDDELHGRSGPIPVRRHPREEWSSIDTAFFEAAIAHGLPEQADLNRPDRHGIGARPRNIDRLSRRVDSAVAYLDPVRERRNLVIRGGVVVQRIRWSGTCATGVDVLHNGAIETIEAAEVILAAGGIASPHILFISGVGPADDLRRCSVPVVADLSGVGAHLRDRPAVMITFDPAAEAVTNNAGYVPLMAAFTAEGSDADSDLQLSLGSMPPAGSHDLQAPGYIAVQLGRERSTGRLHFASGDPGEPPLIEYNYYSDPFDLRRCREGLRVAHDLSRMPSLRPMISRIATGPSIDEIGSDHALDAWIQRNVVTGYTTCGTCRIGSVHDPHAVVDDQCRVIGVQGVRVADLSISATAPSANGFATAVMIGERLAALIDEQK
jgi:choline dehydrogenase